MKTDLADIIKGKGLKSQIYNSISKGKIAQVGKLLKTPYHPRPPTYIDLKSQITETKTDYSSPLLKDASSFQHFSKSVNQSWNDHHHKSSSRLRPKNSREDLWKQHASTSKSKSREKTRSLILKKSNAFGEKAGKTYNRSQLLHSLKQREPKSKDKDKGKDKGLGQARSFKLAERTNLEEIVEQSSSEEKLVTPSSKKSSVAKQASQATKKKTKPQRFSQSFKRRVGRSFKQPETFQKLLKHESLIVSYRVLKRRLLQIQIYAVSPIVDLKVSLEKGNLECQNIQQEFRNVPSSTLLSLFSAVRLINLEQINQFPKIHLQATLQHHHALQRTVVLPYTWLHFVDNKLPSPKKAKITTKLCLADLAINTTKLHILSEIFELWAKKIFKGHSQFETGFCFEQQQFRLKVFEQPKESFALELEGKGEQRLSNMICFLHDLIC